MKQLPIIVAGLVFSLLAAVAASGDTELGSWSVLVRQAETKVVAPALAKESEVYCHFYGIGKFKVFFKGPERTSAYTVDSPVENTAVSFTRLLGAGETEVTVKNVSDPRYDKPSFVGLIATTNAAYVPNVLDAKHPLFGRFRNLSDKDIRIEARFTYQTETDGPFWPGYISAKGFEPSGVLKAQETSAVLSLSRFIMPRTVATFMLHDAPPDTSVEIAFFSDPEGKDLLKTLYFKGNEATNQSIIFYPQPDNTLKFTTISELFQKDLSVIDEAIQKDPSFRRPVPKKAYISVSISDSGEDLETYKNELALARKIGADSCYCNLGRMQSQRASLGFIYGWTMASGFIPMRADWLFDGKTALDYARNNPGMDSIAQKTVIMLCDEPGFNEIAKSAELDKRFRAWMEKKGLSPADAGVADWDAVEAIAPSPAAKRLSTLSREFQVSEEIDYWTGYASAFDSVNPNLLPAVNWTEFEYLDGANMDLWEMYRKPGFGVVWAEDWHGYEPLGTGAIAWYADLMRSQQKYRSLPMGTYPILGWGYSMSLDTMRYYERIMRGCHIFEMYAYSPRGNQGTWLERPEAILTYAKLHRDIAQVEDILVAGQVVPAQAAILYPNSSMIWDKAAHRRAESLYTACLHSGIPLDIITEQDLMDGCGKNYRMLFCFGENIRRDALVALDAFIKEGGTVVSSSPEVRDPYDEPIPEGPEVFGAKEIACLSNEPPGRLVYEFAGAKPIDTVKWNDKEIQVYCQKSKMTPASGAQVLAVFSDGSPALIKTRRGKGVVYLYGFAPGLSYVKADYGGNTNSFGTVLCGNKNERDIATMPARELDNPVKLSEPMVSWRAVAAANASFVGLVDYGLGNVGRKTKNPGQFTVDFEKIEPFPVTMNIACSAKPKDLCGVRCGKLNWTYAGGVVTVQVPLRGVELIVLEGEHLLN